MQLRMTNQREIILQELRRSRRHVTADELYERVRKVLPRISLATVYRNLEKLSEAGMIAKLEISGRQKRFDYEVSEHDHIHCLRCQRVDNVRLDRKAVDPCLYASHRDYDISGYSIAWSGICPECRKQNEQQEK